MRKFPVEEMLIGMSLAYLLFLYIFPVKINGKPVARPQLNSE
jgi:hypothetical protein